MDRRKAIKTCSAVAAVSLAFPSLFINTLRAQERSFKRYKRAPLDIKVEGLTPGKEFLFFYPYVSTPAILINLGEEVPPAKVKDKEGNTYLWQGGVGPQRSIVAYCAICPHQMSHPTPEYSFINYYPDDKPSKIAKRGDVVQCCAHMSVFDAKKGGEVIDGPAEFPLTTIVLEYESGKLYAVGTLGRELYEDFFDVFKPELRKRFKSSRKAKRLSEKCEVVEVSNYSKDIIRC